MLALTEQAATVIKGIVDDSQIGPDGGLRISGTVEGNGEASLEFSVAESPIEGDDVVKDAGATVYLDEIASAVLTDKTLDVSSHDDHYHFSLGEQDEAV
jgi:iron-sulfur cluster assembly protein